MKYIITFAMCLFLMCSCDNHDFELSEKEQVFYINQMLHFSIEPWDSLSKAYSYDFFLRNPKPCKEVDTIYLERKIPNKFEVIESSSYTREYNLDPSFIKLLPNTQYIVSHTGMGARVNIFKYYYTDPFGKLHANDSLNEHINVYNPQNEMFAERKTKCSRSAKRNDIFAKRNVYVFSSL